MHNINSIWDQLIENMNNNPSISDKAMMNGFLTALKPQIISEESLILSTNNSWAKTYIDKEFKQLLSEELSRIAGHKCEVIIVISDFEDSSAEDSSPSLSAVDTNTDFTNDHQPINRGLFSQGYSQIADTDGRSQVINKETDDVINTFHKVMPVDNIHFPTTNSSTFSNHTHASSQHETAESEITNPQNTDTNTERPKSNSERSGKKSGGKTFDSFVVADTNSYAYGAAYSVAENPGEINNPLFIYGRSGLGKTHLLLAIQDYVNRNYSDKIVYYAPATSLVNDYVNSLGTKDWTGFNRKYRGADILLLDDVQYLEGAEETTNEFFKIFNEMISARKHIVLSADRAPKDINLDERLQSRFANGVTADIQVPKFETKLKIFQNHIEHLKEMSRRPDLELPDAVINRVVELSNSNIRNLEGAAASLVTYILYGREDRDGTITVEEAEEVTSKIFFTNINEKITISDIQREVESYFNITHGEMLGSQRPRNISQARQIAMYLSRTLTQSSYPEIGRAFKKDHSSVVHAYKNIEKKRQTNKDFFNEIERISDRIIASEEG